MRFTILCCTITLLGTMSTSAQWTQHVNGLTDWSVGALYADNNDLYAGAITGIFKSTDLGVTWSASSAGLPSQPNFYSIVRSGSFLIAGGDAAGIWRSSDNGGTWVQTTSGVAANEYVLSFTVDGNTVYGAFGYPASVGISTNNGATWSKTSNGLQTTQSMTGIAKIGSSLFACHATIGVYTSTNNGTKWTITSPIGAQDKNAIIASGSSLIVGVSGASSQKGIYHSTDQGVTWVKVRTGPLITGLTKSGAAIYAVGDSLFRSTDDGQTWTALNLDGWPGTAVWNTMQFVQTYAFVNFFGVGVYRSPVSGLVAVNEERVGVPEEFILEHNFPNPFNPSTTISYGLPARAHVTLIVYNVLGENVATLIDGIQDAGFRSASWNADGLASGVYFYKLSAASTTTKEFSTSVGRMILTK
ncbi:MAG: T9SS type A sorting domain-containing protein [Bacteroidota bacterium]